MTEDRPPNEGDERKTTDPARVPTGLRGIAHRLRNRHLARGVAGSIVLYIIATLFGFLVSLMLARILGSSRYGAYAYCMAWVELLAVFAVLGLDRLLIREVAAGVTKGMWGEVRGLVRSANQVVLCASIAIILIAAMIARSALGGSSPSILLPFSIALLYLIPLPITRIRQATLQGFKHVVLGQLPETVIRPAVFTALIAISFLISGKEIHVWWALLMNVVAITAAFIAATVLLRSRIPDEFSSAEPACRPGEWARSAMVLLSVVGTILVAGRIGPVMLGALCGTEPVGIYTIAARGAWFILVGPIAVSTVVSPTVSSLHAVGDRAGMKGVSVRGSRAAFLISALLMLGLLIGGRWILSVFGPEFVAGFRPMLILGAGLLLGTAVAPAMSILMMTGHEKDAAMGAILGLVLIVLLSILAIPRLGIDGAALSAAVGNVFQNLYHAVAVRRRLGFNPAAFTRL